VVGGDLKCENSLLNTRRDNVQIFYAFENVRGPITDLMLTHACGKMPGCFAAVTGITARTCKLVYNTRTKPSRNGVVVLDRSDCDRGILKIINDASKFRPIKEDPTLLREGTLQRLLRKLRKDGHLDSDVYENIYPKGSQPARIYGLPKMHKDRGPNSAPPFRPIVSSIGAYNYNLAKYLYN